MQTGRFRKVFKCLRDNDPNEDYSVLGEFPYNTHLTLDYDWNVYLDRDIDHNFPHCLPLICFRPSLNPLFHFYSCSQPLTNCCSSLVIGQPESHHNLHMVQKSTVSFATNSPHHPHPTATSLAPGEIQKDVKAICSLTPLYLSDLLHTAISCWTPSSSSSIHRFVASACLPQHHANFKTLELTPTWYPERWFSSSLKIKTQNSPV